MPDESLGWSNLLGMGAVIAAELLVALGLGWLVDKLLGTGPVFLLVGLLLGIVAGAFAGHALCGVFCCVGLALGAVNNRLLQKSVLHFAASEHPSKKRFRRGVITRLGAVTIIAIGVGVLVQPDGLGVFVGLAVFQV